MTRGWVCGNDERRGFGIYGLKNSPVDALDTQRKMRFSHAHYLVPITDP
jgi:hypothetical protein